VNPGVLRHKIAIFAELFRKTRALAELNATLEARIQERTSQLEQRTQDLQRANRSKDEFLAMVSHELRTPLNAMLGWATLLNRELPPADRLKRGLDVILRNIRAQEQLVNDLLDASRIVSGKLRLTMSTFSLADAIGAATEAVRAAAEGKNVSLLVEVDHELGVMVGDAGRLQQVAWNLLSNAIRYTPSGGRVTLTATRENGAHVVRVEDTGIGIAAEHLRNIFEPFHQVDGSMTRSQGGLGLGLALVRHLVEAHGGSVEARSDGPGCGSAFSFTIPIRAVDPADVAAGVQGEERAEAEHGDPSASDQPPASSRWTRTLCGIHALVVDDHADSLDVVRLVLEHAGARVTGVTNAGDALAAIDAGTPFEVIVSDIGMPGMDGYEFMRRVRESVHGRAVPAVALTAYARVSDVARAKAAGYQEQLAKPVNGGTLVATVGSLARRPLSC
jgi:signal transduction histidine kinase/CheY-like chemotaxis protein